MLHPKLDVQNAQIPIARSTCNFSPRAGSQKKVWTCEAHDQVATSSDQIHLAQQSQGSFGVSTQKLHLFACR
jgi:hypothetical protein